MTHQREHEYDNVAGAERANNDVPPPGRTSASAALRGPAAPSPSGIVMRKARDDNGVAADAETAVATAATGTGAALPSTLMRKFESSLSADLSSVRVHTGHESAAAADSVGAKAYTVGNDIHFNSGQYDPSSQDGQRLLAHEVAHTVQQSGSASHGPQFKLEVSHAGDALEVEADHAAEAMINGAPATLSGGGATIARKIETRTDIEKAGDAGATDPASQGGLGASTAGEIKVQGKDAAQSLASDIASWQGRLGENAGMEGKVAANIQVMGKLENVVAASDSVGFAVSGFTSLFSSTKSEYGRLMAMASSPAFAGLGFGKPNAQSGEAAAEDHAQRADGGNSASSELTERAKKIADTSGPNGGENKLVTSALARVKISEEETHAAATQVADKQTKATASMTGVTGAHQTLAGINASAKAKATKEGYEKVKAEYEKMKKALDESFALFDKLKSTADGAMTDPGGTAKGVAYDAFKEIAVLVLIGDPPKTDDEEKKAAREQEESEVKAFNGALNTFNSEGKKVGGAIKDFSEAIGALSRAKSKHKQNVKELGQEFDRNDPAQKGKKRASGEAGTFETIAMFQGQADAFLATAEATKQVGQRDLTRGGTGTGGDASPTESAAQSAANAIKDAESMTAYKIEDRMTEVSDTDPNETGAQGGSAAPGKTSWQMRAHLTSVPVVIQSDLKDDETCHEDPTMAGGLEGNIHKSLAELDGYVTQIKAYKTKLAGIMGM